MDRPKLRFQGNLPPRLVIDEVVVFPNTLWEKTYTPGVVRQGQEPFMISYEMLKPTGMFPDYNRKSITVTFKEPGTYPGPGSSRITYSNCPMVVKERLIHHEMNAPEEKKEEPR